MKLIWISLFFPFWSCSDGDIPSFVGMEAVQLYLCHVVEAILASQNIDHEYLPFEQPILMT
jgi:hypothetical protein